VSDDRPMTPRITLYTEWLRRTRGLAFDDYESLRRWSVGDLAAFWDSIWRYFDIESPTAYGAVLEREVMPGAKWFAGAQLNYARQALRHADAAHAGGHPAIVWQNERMREPAEVSWPELRRQTASLAARLAAMGVAPGDRVCAVLPNTPHAVVAFLACASIGAIWSMCSPDMGPVAVLDRFRQIEPKVLIAVDGYVHGAQRYDRLPIVQQLIEGLPSLAAVVLLRDLDPDAALPAGRAARHDFAGLVADDVPFEPRWVAFDHPLWIVYSSGTTGLPKAIVHGHGGIVLQMLMQGTLHQDLGASADTGDRYHWYSSTGWIMWNAQVGALLGGTTICIYDGNPAGDDWSALWRFASAARVTFFGAGAAFFASCLKADVQPTRVADLSRLRAIGSTGSPLADECHDWIRERLPKVDGERIWLAPMSGGTDFAGAFVAGMRTLPVVRGEMQCRCLGAAVEAWDEHGTSLDDAVGELVCTKPMPSMPLRFWNDADGSRYHASYFDMYPGVWRHGDWMRITPRGGAIIYGRSDATINRHGIRMGTAELYRAVEALPEVLDSLVVDLEYLGRESYMPLFVVLREGIGLDAALEQRIRQAIKSGLSARHVPNDVLQVAAVPRTLSGKKMELPVKNLLQGGDPARLFNRDAMANADSIAWFVDFAARRASSPLFPPR